MSKNVERFSKMSNEDLFSKLTQGNLSELQARAIAAVIESRFPTPERVLDMMAAA